MHFEVQFYPFTISTDPDKLDVRLVHDYLSNHSYWAAGIPLETVERSVRNSLCFGLYYESGQIGFARVVTDFATFAYLADVFVMAAFRGQGLSKRMMESIIAHPGLQGLRRWMLATADAHGLYKQYGFTPLGIPERWMEKHHPDVYKKIQ